MALYKNASEILEKVERKKGTVKTLVYDSKFQVRIIITFSMLANKLTFTAQHA